MVLISFFHSDKPHLSPYSYLFSVEIVTWFGTKTRSFKKGNFLMGFKRFSWMVIFLLWVFISLCLNAHGDGGNISVNFLEAPLAISPLATATFVFEVFEGGDICRNCSIKCKLDHILSDCGTKKVSYMGLDDGQHTFEVCINGSGGARSRSYNWTIDTIPPTAYVSAETSFTNALNFSVNIAFSEPCTGGGGFSCVSSDACNLLVYGPGEVIPSTLKIIQRDLKFSLFVKLSPTVQYGRVILVMDKNFCTDGAGYDFTRTTNSSFFVHFDRRSVVVNLRTHIPQKILQLNHESRTVEATNNNSNLKVYLYFSKPVLNSSLEILSLLQTSAGLLLPTNGKTNGDRRFGYLVKNISSMDIVTIGFQSSFVISRYGTPVSPIAPVTFLYDSKRPSVRLSTTSSMRTRKHRVPIHIKFFKPVYGFNSSTISVSGGHLQSFHGITQSLYYLDIYADDNIISVNVPENITMDIAGNGNLASNVLQVKHYTVPTISFALSTFANAAFAATSLAAVMLTISTASLQSIGGSSRRSFFMSGPARNLFRIACHMQVFALSRWLVVNLPVEYYEFSRGLEWTIPHLNLPWETGHVPTNVADSTPSAMAQSKVLKRHESGSFKRVTLGHQNSEMATTFLLGLPLTPMEYKSYFESQNIKPEAEHIFGSHNSNGWRMFNQNMFWLAVIGGGLLLLHALVLLILKFRRKSSEEWRNYGAVVLPRFEIFLLILALPCVCQASAALIKGGATTGTIVGILVLGVPSFLLLALLLFLSIGITMGKLLQYKEVHQEGEKFHWYQVIVRVTLGPGKRGQWTWKNQPNSVYLTMFGPLFEDLRGPPKYMLLEFSGGNPRKHGDQIIASDDENEDAEAPLIQKIFGILRIYYTLLELVKRVSLGVVAGAYTSSESSTTPSLMLLCITSFQLFFLVLKKPFIKKKVQLVEIVSVTSEVGIFVICLLLSKKEFFFKDEMKVGILMLLLFLVAFIVQMINEWYALYKQILQLDPAEKHFSSGLKTASIGLLLILIPQNMVKKLELNLYRSPETRETGISTGRYRSSGSRSSGTPDKPWLRQLRELAKASFSKDDTEGPTDPSSSQTRKSGFWSTMRSESGVKRSGGPSLTSSTDFKSRPKALYRDLESIFSSK